MKSTSIISSGLSLMAAIVLSVSCQEFNIDTQPDGTPHMETDVLTEYVRTAASPQKITFNISSTTPWTIERSNDAEWCSLTPASSALSSLSTEVSIVLEDNPTYEDREVVFTLSAEGIDKKYDIKVSQARKGRLLVQPIDEAFQAEGGVQTLVVTSNNDWELTSDNQWLSFEPSKGTASDKPQTIKVTAAKNNGAKRITNIHLVTNGDEYSYEVTQKGYYIEFSDLESGIMDIPSDGGLAEIKVRSNVEWIPVCDDESVMLEKKDDKTLSVRLPANKFFLPKEVVVKIIPSDPELEGIVEASLTFRQQINSHHIGGDCKIDENGLLVITSYGGGDSRYAYNQQSGLGTYIWTLESINLSAAGWIHLQMWPDNDSDNANLNFWFNGGENYMVTGGSVKSEITGKNEGFWSDPHFNSSLEELNSLKEIRITILPIEDHLEEIAIYFNGNLKLRYSAHPDIWYHKPGFRFRTYYGLYPEASCASSMKVKSFEIIPYEG